MKIFRQNGCFFLLGKNNLFHISSFVVVTRLRERRRKKKKRRSLSCVARQTSNHVWSEDASAEKTDWGERFFGDLIVNNDDICFKHILPRLNSTDLKFLYGVNSETRKLIKRSSRKGDLKERFKSEEMSSISTLEFVWENKSLWPSDWDDEKWFCMKVATTNKLELLTWARERKSVSGI